MSSSTVTLEERRARWVRKAQEIVEEALRRNQRLDVYVGAWGCRTDDEVPAELATKAEAHTARIGELCRDLRAIEGEPGERLGSAALLDRPIEDVGILTAVAIFAIGSIHDRLGKEGRRLGELCVLCAGLDAQASLVVRESILSESGVLARHVVTDEHDDREPPNEMLIRLCDEALTRMLVLPPVFRQHHRQHLRGWFRRCC